MTKLLYMDDFDVTVCCAEVIKLDKHEDMQVVVLNQTCFYPKGGGQDFDQGTINSKLCSFEVEAVFFVDGEVKHLGHYKNASFKVGDKVDCTVNESRRTLNTRIHSAGHVLDMAVRGLAWQWRPGKGAHYPDMAFVEYSGKFDSEQRQKLIEELQSEIDRLINVGSLNTIKFMTPKEMISTGAIVPDNIPEGKPSRVVFYNDFAVPCGGTHVKDIKDISNVTITKIKNKDGNIRVSYRVQ